MAHIVLTTAYDPGDLDVVSYAHVKVLQYKLSPESKTVNLQCKHGNVDGGVFTEGKLQPQYHSITNIVGGTQHFDVLAAVNANTNEDALAAFERVCYQWLLDQSKYVGSLA